MLYLVNGQVLANGTLRWITTQYGADQEQIIIAFPLLSKFSAKKALKYIRDILTENKIEWLFESGKKWFINCDQFVNYIEVNEFKNMEWLKGTSEIDPDVDTETREVFGKEREETSVEFFIDKEVINLNSNKKIFLSHRGTDKPYVRRINTTLKLLGFDTWLDEEILVAGSKLERDLLKGIQSSCASVFFITPNYEDRNYLATEIDYSILEKRKKGDRFSIITLILKDADGSKGQVPDLLSPYVWKEPTDELDALIEIIKALPVKVGSVIW